MTGTTVRVDGATLAVATEGTGEPLLVVQTALDVDELTQLTHPSLLRDRYRIITFHRRGYGGSSDDEYPTSIATDAQDCLDVLTALDALPAHVVGVSFSAAIAMELASRAPDTVRTLTVVEPPPVHVASGSEFRDINARLQEMYERQGVTEALDTAMSLIVGPDWRAVQEESAPGSVARIERDADAFFRRDLPALLSWQFGPAQAGRVTSPVLGVTGSDSGPLFAQASLWLSSLFPNAHRVLIDGAGHDLALTHPQELARVVAQFLADHTFGGGLNYFS